MNDKVIKVIAEISGRLGRGWEFEMQSLFGGVQCNWRKEGLNVMWRNVNCWDVELVEMYKKGGIDELIRIDKL